jgi:hypothetical protein
VKIKCFFKTVVVIHLSETRFLWSDKNGRKKTVGCRKLENELFEGGRRPVGGRRRDARDRAQR